MSLNCLIQQYCYCSDLVLLVALIQESRAARDPAVEMQLFEGIKSDLQLITTIEILSPILYATLIIPSGFPTLHAIHVKGPALWPELSNRDGNEEYNTPAAADPRAAPETNTDIPGLQKRLLQTASLPLQLTEVCPVNARQNKELCSNAKPYGHNQEPPQTCSLPHQRNRHHDDSRYNGDQGKSY